MLGGMETTTRPFLPSDRPDAHARDRDQHRSLVRACTAMALGFVSRRDPEEYLRSNWPEDHGAKLVLRSPPARTR
jgi:hypothetical protein